MNLRQFITWARESGELVEIEAPVDPCLEQARVEHALGGRPVLFNSLMNYPSWRAISGMCARRDYFAAALGCTVPELVHRLALAAERPIRPAVRPAGPCQETILSPPDLSKLPIPRYHALDGGPYITSGIVIVRDPEYGRNAAIHRLMLVDTHRLAIRIVKGRGTDTALKRAPQKLPVAIAIGCPIQVLLAAAMSPPKGVDELGVANALAATELAACQTVDVEVPADAELVLEGYITTSETREGSFPDLTGTMDITRMQRVVEIQHITHRRDPIFHSLLPGGLEHKNLMGMPREPTIFSAVDQVCACTGVYITPGGASWLHAVVQIDKQSETDGHKSIMAAFSGHPSLKHVVVVDTDIDIYSSADVEWAIATRFQADQDIVILRDQDSSSLDPSATKAPGRKSRTAKMGLDATAPLGEARREYERITYAPIDLLRLGLSKLS